ncbi:aminotransferase-like domain-containing protein [Chitinibacteraceae bacterium HSL-7]
MNDVAPRPLYQQLADELTEAIASGRYRSGERMPSVRKLAQERGLSLTTVVEAYRTLEDRGLLNARPQSGYYVQPAQTAGPSLLPPLIHSHPFWPEGAKPSGEVRTDFGYAILHAEWFPVHALQRVASQIMRDDPAVLADYGESRGDIELRRHIARRALSWGGRFDADEVVITSGCLEALNLCLRAVTRPGDVVAVESPTYFGLLQILESLGLQALEIPTDPKTGVSLEALDLATRQHAVKACLLIPSYANPIGSLMPIERKMKLVRLLAERGIPLIEDDIYGEFGTAPARVQPAKAFDPPLEAGGGNVMLCSSFNKVLAAGMRVGWVVAGRWQREIERLKFVNTYSTPALFQKTIAAFLENGGFDHHLRRLRRTLSEQVKVAHQCVVEAFPQGTICRFPEGGYILWVELPEALDARRLLAAALAEGINFAPGELFGAAGRYRHCFRLCVTQTWTTRHEAAVRRLGALAAELLPAQRVSS